MVKEELFLLNFYINTYFHFNPPYTVPCEKFMFDISDKGGIGETRNPNLEIEKYKTEMLTNKDSVFDIRGGNICW